jgi:putative ABC transport system ATP-binding protein
MIEPPQSHQKSIIAQFNHVDKDFQTAVSEVSVLRDISFTIPEGSFTILHGPSGSGKTTILNTLIGLEPPTAGEVIINNQNVYKLNSDERAHFRNNAIGMVHQDNYWVNSLTVQENVALPLLLAGWKKSKAMFLAQQSIIRVGLEKFVDYNPTVLSGGQQQRISFARATVIKPKLLVADEPTGNLDSISGQLIIRLLQDFNNKHQATIVLVTHNDALLEISNNVISIKDGRIDVNSSALRQSKPLQRLVS